MKIGGLNSFSLCDFPGKVSAVVFTQGCNFKCRFCHNGFLIPCDVSQDLLVPEEAVIEFLQERRHQLDGVVVSGGEPTLQPDLTLFLSQLKKMNLAIKLDTNGSRPAVIHRLLEDNLVDYIAMDIKAPLELYNSITRIPETAIANIQESINIISKSGIEHEFRTTVVEPLLSSSDMCQIRQLVPGRSPHRLQKFHPERALDPLLKTMTNKNFGG